VKDLGFPDHSALPLEHLVHILVTMKNFLDEDPEHVVAVHCLAGRGRTGMVISSFLLHIGLCKDATEALRYFAHSRSSTGEGVITPSQIRYVRYYAAVLQGTVPNPIGNEKKLVLKKIIMEPCPVVPGTEELGITGGWTPVVQIFTLAGPSPEECLYSSNNSLAFSYNTRDHPQCVMNIEPNGCVVKGEIQVSTPRPLLFPSFPQQSRTPRSRCFIEQRVRSHLCGWSRMAGSRKWRSSISRKNLPWFANLSLREHDVLSLTYKEPGA